MPAGLGFDQLHFILLEVPQSGRDFAVEREALLQHDLRQQIFFLPALDQRRFGLIEQRFEFLNVSAVILLPGFEV